MKAIYINLILFITLICSSGCSKQMLISTGAKDHEPLLFNNEYKTENLKEIEVKGSALFGIPSFRKNNQNNHSKGFLYTFNGVELGRLPRIIPILTMLGYTFYTGRILQEAFGYRETREYDPYSGRYYGSGGGDYKLPLVPAMILAVPVSGLLNNPTWNNSAYSGAASTFNYRLINENPTVDVFFYPKYDIKKSNVFSKEGVKLKYLWMQDATLKGRVSGATLIHK